MSFPITTMCRVLKVNVSSYYHWIKMGCVLEKVDTILNELIEDIFKAGRQAYGQRRIKEDLVQRYGLIVSKRRIGKIMRSLNLVPKMKRRFRVYTTDSKHNLPIAPNLLN
ncbi:MAG TPA: transposase, partial [Sulfurimonas sp.]|nr:transposase [Sulfurimonas sp.]